MRFFRYPKENAKAAFGNYAPITAPTAADSIRVRFIPGHRRGLEGPRRTRGHATWLWTLAYGHHEDRTPIYGYEPTREAAMAAFAKSWRRQ